MKGQQLKQPSNLQTLRMTINLLTPALCGIVLVELCLQIIWNYFISNIYMNDLLATALVGCLLFATMEGILGKNSYASTITSGIFYLFGGFLSLFIDQFDIVILNITISMQVWALLLIIIGVFFIYCGQYGK